MEDSRIFADPRGSPAKSVAGIISRVRLENFMCHSSLEIELGDWVNFITGQNGSGKSAILTALCVAFGCRAKSTQRASSLKDFIKNGCNYASVFVEIKNQGEDAFKQDTYGDLIILERRITESGTTTILKNYQGRKVSNRRDELRELVEHFNIDVENPCVIMTQDKSREFLHSGNDKDKFKFFFKATLLQQVSELLQNIKDLLDAANASVHELEASIRPILKELHELHDKIKNMEHVEEIAHEVQLLKKKLAWCWVYDVDKQIQEQNAKLEKLKARVPACQEKIDKYTAKVEELKEILLTKKAKIASLMEKTSEVRVAKEDLQQKLSLATKERLELEEEHSRGSNTIKKMYGRIKSLEQQIQDIQEQHIKATQTEEDEIEEQMRKLQDEVDKAQKSAARLREEEICIAENLAKMKDAIKDIAKEIEDSERKSHDLYSHIRELNQRQANKVTTFGGGRVLNLLQAIERRHRKFRSPPIGPVGAHVTLLNGDFWALAVDCAIGRLLDAFVVTDHKDSLLLRACAREANYHNLQIIIYDFSRPRLNIPKHLLPATEHPTTLSVIHSDNDTIMNVLVDLYQAISGVESVESISALSYEFFLSVRQGSAERQVLVRDYELGKLVAFDQRIQNMKEVYTSDGYKITIHDQLHDMENEASKVQELIREGKGRKRDLERSLGDLEIRIQTAKKRRINEERFLMAKQIALRDLKSAHAAEHNNADPTLNVDELHQEITDLQDQIHLKQMSLEKIKVRMTIAQEKADDLRSSFDNLCDSTRGEIDAIEAAEQELVLSEENLCSAEQERSHYEGIMGSKVRPDIRAAEELLEELQHTRQENFRKASIICPEDETESLGGCARSTPEQLSAQLSRLQQRHRHESQRYTESIDDLREMYEKRKRRISTKQDTYNAFREKLGSLQQALDLRWNKFQRNAALLKRQLTWQFNGHLRKKGISGHIKVDYEAKTLSIEVKMPQDASGNVVRDTRGLSGGERSFSTLCFALSLHEMTEAPIRAMDEFDVFMDAVSRKISLDTLVDFAISQGSQWIFITPHDISMIKPGERIRKQQMAAPRS